MKKFTFKLQPVLKHRQKKEDILKREFADIKQLYDTEVTLLNRLKDKLTDLHAGLRVKQDLLVDVPEINALSNYMAKIERDIEMQIARVVGVENEMRDIQERLIRASRDKKVLEKLYDKKYEEYKQESEKVEQRSIDEIATIRHGRHEAALIRGMNLEQS